MKNAKELNLILHVLREPMSTLSTEDFATVLARFATGVTADRLPNKALVAAKMNLFDTLACAAAGSSAAGVTEVLNLVTEWGGAPQATVLVFGHKLPAHQVAWINGMMSHARDYDDTHDAAVLHAGVSVVPAALAAAELVSATGADLIAGIAAGLETISRIGIATRIGIIESGYMYTPLFGHFAATVAASRVMGLDVPTMINAIGISYSQVAGNHQVTRDAALTKRMQPGFAAMSAVLSVQLAKRGIRGVQSTFEGVDGFFRVYLHDQVDRDVLRSELGTQFEFMRLSYKPYPCCRFNHAAIDAAIDLRRTKGIKHAEIKHVKVGLNKQAFEAVCTPIEIRKAPKTVVQAQFSIPYTVASALVDGCVQLGHFAEKALQRADILTLAQKVDPYIDAEIEKTCGRNVTPAVLEIEMMDNTVHTWRIDLPLGHPDRPMTSIEMNAKAQDCFRAAAAPMQANAHEELHALVERVEALSSVQPLMAIMRAKG
jgi:2-methylcitrate dehydratase PrpD